MDMRTLVETVNQQHKEAGMVISPHILMMSQKCKTAMIPVWENWANSTGPEAKAVLEDLKALLGK